jgi:transposase
MVIMVAIDMHVKRLVCELSCEREKPTRCTYSNDETGQRQLLDDVEAVRSLRGAGEVVVAYEASGLGYGLYDRIRSAGYRGVVLAPTELLRSANGYKTKTDRKDCSFIYEAVRAHVLAGNRLPEVWVPCQELREDREMVRCRFSIGEKLTKVKVQIHTLLKKFGIKKPDTFTNWTAPFQQWLERLAQDMGSGFGTNMRSLLRQLTFLKTEVCELDRDIKLLSREDRYRDQCEQLMRIPGVGLLTAMTFLTEIGDAMRFRNRRQVGAFMGLVPASYESGDASDRKGRITRDGPHRLRCVLNQALWAHLRCNGSEKELYDRITEKNPRRKKKAVVACMRRLGIRMWHVVRDVQFSKQVRLVA